MGPRGAAELCRPCGSHNCAIRPAAGKAQDGQYATARQLRADFEAIIRNAVAYNSGAAPGSEARFGERTAGTVPASRARVQKRPGWAGSQIRKRRIHHERALLLPGCPPAAVLLAARALQDRWNSSHYVQASPAPRYSQATIACGGATRESPCFHRMLCFLHCRLRASAR